MAAGTDRLRSAMQTFATDALNLIGDMNASTIMFKLLAEDLEKEHESDKVEELGKGLLQVLATADELKLQAGALQILSETYELSSEEINFEQTIRDAMTQIPAAEKQADLTKNDLFKQFQQAVWNVHHAGEALPGQEAEDIVMITSQFGVRNKTCPLSGKPVTELQDPVCSNQCRHVYDRTTVTSYIQNHDRNQRGRKKPCHCPISGCPKKLDLASLFFDSSVMMEIQELRLREASNSQSQFVADCTEAADDQFVELDDD